MALASDELYLPVVGHIFTAPVGTAAPTDLSALNAETGEFTSGATGWTNIGHTARGELPELGFDGGDREAKGTWQREVQRYVTTEAVADYVIVNVHQFNNDTLALYYGGTGGSTAGRFEVSGTASSVPTRALLIVIVDGDNRVAFHANDCDVTREDSVEMDTEEFVYLPLRFSIKSATPYKLAWIADGLGPVVP